jgi:hypothetical protein
MNKEEKQQQIIDQWNEKLTTKIIDQWSEKFDLMVRERNYWRDRCLKATKDLNNMQDSIERLKNQVYNLSKKG